MTTTDRRNGLLVAIAVKAPCKLATTANITLSGLQSIDGTSTAADDRVLVKDQTTTTENGIYIASSGNWTRATDFDSGADVDNGTLVLATDGSANANIIYRVVASGDITIDSTALAFTPFLFTNTSSTTLTATTFSAGNGSAAAPSYTFGNDTDCGLYRIGADNLGFALNGVIEINFTTTAWSPGASDGLALGTSSLMWSDIFLASGAVINWNNGDVTATHAANTLTFAGASSGYVFDAALKPSANDGAALGVSGTAFSDLFLAVGGVINWGAGDITITHASNALTIAGGAVAIQGSGTNDSAAAGFVGEHTTATLLVGSAVSLTSTTSADITSISLTAGDWDVHGVVVFNAAAGTTYTDFAAAISTTSATLPTIGVEGYSQGGNQGTGKIIALPTGTVRVSLASTTTVYLVANAEFGTSTMTAYGTISARRVR